MKTVLQVPLSDVSGTLGKNGQPGGSVVGVQSQTELRVIRVLMVLYAVACDNVVTFSHGFVGHRDESEVNSLSGSQVS